MKKNVISIIIVVLVVFTLGLYCYFNFGNVEILSSTSPDGEYRIVIFEQKKWLSIPGNGSSRCVKIKLYKGFWSIEQECNDCPTFSSEIMTPRWDLEAMQVYYAPARSVNLVTGKCEE
ncbi:MAG: hypothetical protein AB8B74_09670 [Crocinitomicaceae bacterium]